MKNLLSLLFLLSVAALALAGTVVVTNLTVTGDGLVDGTYAPEDNFFGTSSWYCATVNYHVYAAGDGGESPTDWAIVCGERHSNALVIGDFFYKALATGPTGTYDNPYIIFTGTPTAVFSYVTNYVPTILIIRGDTNTSRISGSITDSVITFGGTCQ